MIFTTRYNTFRTPSFTKIVSTAFPFALATLLPLIAVKVNASVLYESPSQVASAQQAVSQGLTIPTPSSGSIYEGIELPLPASGEVHRYDRQNGVAPLQILSSPGENYLIKLDDVNTGRPVVSVFIRGGQTEEILVPLGEYVVKYASGNQWYGSTRLFGPNTQYSKTDQNFTFIFDGRQYNGYSITLYAVPDGNLETIEISPEDF